MKRVHILYGQGGYSTSIGMHTFGASLDKTKYTVSFWNYGDWQKVAAKIASEPTTTAVIGYSLGANAAAWMMKAFPNLRVQLLVGYDPTANGPALSLYPIPSRVKRCLCYQQTSYIGTSVFFGRGLYVRAADGPKIEVTQFRSDHLMVPFNKSLHALTLSALEKM